MRMMSVAEKIALGRTLSVPLPLPWPTLTAAAPAVVETLAMPPFAMTMLSARVGALAGFQLAPVGYAPDAVFQLKVLPLGAGAAARCRKFPTVAVCSVSFISWRKNVTSVMALPLVEPLK